MSAPDQAVLDALTEALFAYATSAPGGEAAFVLVLVPPGGTGGVISNLNREGVLDVLSQYLDHQRRMGAPG